MQFFARKVREKNIVEESSNEKWKRGDEGNDSLHKYFSSFRIKYFNDEDNDIDRDKSFLPLWFYEFISELSVITI